ncbi:hypothetical protein HPB47_019339, partial [Ixodes persulcatus]
PNVWSRQSTICSERRKIPISHCSATAVLQDLQEQVRQRPYWDQITKADFHPKDPQRLDHDGRHAARRLPDLRPGDRVWIKDVKRYGRVTGRGEIH